MGAPTARAFVTFAQIGLFVGLIGCSSVEHTPLDPGPPPDVSKAKPFLNSVAAQYHLTGPLEVAGPIQASSVSSVPWIICLRSPATPQLTYAVFFRAEAYVSSRISIIGDRCDSQSYQPLPTS
jgi:hypothetical protein